MKASGSALPGVVVVVVVLTSFWSGRTPNWTVEFHSLIWNFVKTAYADCHVVRVKEKRKDS